MSLNVRSGQGQVPTFVFVQSLLSCQTRAISPNVRTGISTPVLVPNVPGLALGKFNATAQNHLVVQIPNVPGVSTAALPAVSNFRTRVNATLKNLPVGGNGVVHSVVASSTPPDTGIFPLSVHSSGRYLIDSNGTPFIIQGDTAWSLAAQLTNTEIDTYLSDRHTKGYTAILFNAIEHWFTSQTPAYKNADGVAPFSTMTDFASALTTYWNRVDYIVDQCAALGIFVFINPAYEGSNSQEGWSSELSSASAADLQTYGQRLAQRYQQGNVGLCMGGDLSGTSSQRSKQWNIVTGWRSINPNILVTAHGDANTSAYSAGWSSFTSSGFNVNSTYAYPEAGFELYSITGTEYARTPAMPVFTLETRYEQENGVGQAQLRRQTYQALLSGACGQLFGNNPIWHFECLSSRVLFSFSGTWESNLNSTGNVQQSYAHALFASVEWWKLVPSTGTGLVTTALGSGSSRICPALASDGTLGMVWKPSSGAITVNMAAFSVSKVRARFFDPTTGTYANVTGSPFANTGTQSITFPGERVLVLDTTRDLMLSATPLTQSVSEGSIASITVTAERAFSTATQLPFTVTPTGGAVAGVDYIAPSSPLTLAAGQTSVALSIQILSDAVSDPGEAFDVTWGTPSPNTPL